MALNKTRKNRKLIDLVRKKRKGGVIKRIRLIELGGQFPTFNRKNDIFTIQIESCGIGECKIKWIKTPDTCCKWNIPIVFDKIRFNKDPPYNFWFMGDADYKVVFLNQK